MQIYCSSPVVIRNPRILYYAQQYQYFHTESGFHKNPYFKSCITESSKRSLSVRFSPKRLEVTQENMEKFYFFDPTTGETVPMFILVPCGKCELCLDKKKKEWSFRAHCENSTSTSVPLFLTLTFAPKNLPKRGVQKEDVQLFMKRMRIRLDRMGIKHNIRYFFCGEYGHNSKMPHYHGILWNFPREEFPTLHACLDFIEKCWCHPLYDRYGNAIYNKDGSPVTEQLGFCYVSPVQYDPSLHTGRGVIGYVMKYMTKKADVPFGKNPVFYLSSRKNGGLGAEYARNMASYYMSNPDCVEMSVYDPYSCKNVRSFMPQYFRNLYFPSLSRIVGSEIHKVWKKYVQSLHDLYYLCRHAGFESRYVGVDLNLARKFSFFPETFTEQYLFPSSEIACMIYNDAPDDFIFGTIYKLEEDLVCLRQLLFEFEPDYTLMDTVQKCKDVRESFMLRYFKDKKDLDLNSVKNSIIYQQNLAYIREKV